MTIRLLELRTRPAAHGIDQPGIIVRREWDPTSAAAIICDMWDAHHCVSAARRVAEMAPRMNAVIADLRDQGTLIIHAPADCADFYRDTAGRQRAIDAPYFQAPRPIDWNGWEHETPGALPITLTAPGACSCSSPGRCGGGQPPYPWTRQTPAIDIDPRDAVSDDGQEVFNLLESRGIVDVIVMGVHTNICVLGRSYGIRQLVYSMKRPILCRDLTDSFHCDPHGHAWGTEQVIAHVERRWCPTVTSDQLVGGAPFQFAG